MAAATRTQITAAEYALLPETTHPMELIDGEIVEMPTPKNEHQRLLGLIVQRLLKLIPGGELRFAPMDVYLDELNVVQPDVFWVAGPESRWKLGEDGWWSRFCRHLLPCVTDVRNSNSIRNTVSVSIGLSIRLRDSSKCGDSPIKKGFSAWMSHSSQQFWAANQSN